MSPAVDAEHSSVHRRQARSQATRSRLLHAAEVLYAKNGIGHVSQRAILEFAGEANKAALTYHFGQGEGVLRELLRQHADELEQHRHTRQERMGESATFRDMVALLVLPLTDHLEELGVKSTYARLVAQVEADPRLRHLSREVDFWPVPLVRSAMSGRASEPEDVLTIRLDAARITVIGVCAEREEHAEHAGQPADWDSVGQTLTDLVTAILTTRLHQ